MYGATGRAPSETGSIRTAVPARPLKLRQSRLHPKAVLDDLSPREEFQHRVGDVLTSCICPPVLLHSWPSACSIAQSTLARPAQRQARPLTGCDAALSFRWLPWAECMPSRFSRLRPKVGRLFLLRLSRNRHPNTSPIPYFRRCSYDVADNYVEPGRSTPCNSSGR